MVALKTGEIDGFVARPSSNYPVVLVYGPDAGLVRERAQAIVRASVDNADDPFQLARIDGEDLSGNPARLVEEANTIPLFGGRRAVWVKAGGRNIAPAAEAVLAAPSPDCRVVIEAGDLKKNAPLRALFERARNAAAIPCYPDTDRDLARLIDDELRSADLTIAPDARAALLPLLGGDRQASRNEVRKLALYARGKERVELDDVMAVVADASTLALDAIIDGAFAGRVGEAETAYAKARSAGTPPGSIIFAAQRHVAQLHKAVVAIEGGAPPSQQADAMYVHFSRKSALEAALRVWSSQRLERAMAQLADAQLESRRQSALADSIVARALLSIAVQARRKG